MDTSKFPCLGAIIGDTVGSVYEFDNIKTTDFQPLSEGIKGAQATAAAIFMARQGETKEAIRTYIEQTFGYDLKHTCDEIRPYYDWESSCQGTVPPAFLAFFDSHDFEESIRLAVSLGGDSDTLACITGGIAQAYYKEIPDEIIEQMQMRLPKEFWEVMEKLAEL